MEKFGLSVENLDKIISVLKKYSEIEKAVIFGSRARGNFRPGSDIDIALYGTKLTHTLNTKIFYELDNLYLIYKIDLININSLKNEDKLKENILKEGVEIYAK